MKLNNKSIFIVLITYFTCCSLSFAQTFNVNGWVKNAQTTAPMPNATVVAITSQKGVISDEKGFFTLKIPTDTVHLECSYVGYEPIRLSFFLIQDTTITIYLEPSLKLQTVEIIASETPRPEDITSLSTVKLSAKQINQVPTFFGEQDVLKVLQLLPGVQSGAEGQSGLQVRGGSPDQNLILLDGIPVYNPAHLFGFFSTFNGAVVEDVSFITGGFPAQYAGRLSSIVDISTQKGSLKKWNTAASLGFVSGKLMMQGPIIKNKTSILLAARRSLLDLWEHGLLNQTYQSPFLNGDASSDYIFKDYNATVFHQLTKKDQIILRVFEGTDDFFQEQNFTSQNNARIQNDLGTAWKNASSSIGWNRTWNNRINSTFLIYQNNYTYGQDRLNIKDHPDVKEKSNFNYKAGIKDIGLQWTFNHQLFEQHQLTYGINIIQHDFFTGDYDASYSNSSFPSLDFDTTYTTPPIHTIESGIFLEDEWQINTRLSMKGGLHLAGYQSENKTYISLQPRLSIRSIGLGDIAYKFSLARMQQHLHLLTTESGGFPTDLWLPATDQVRPQTGWVFAAQIARTFGNLEITLEPYYRNIKNPLAFKEGKSILNPEDWQQKVTQGQGEMYGAEFLVRKKKGNLTGWLAYTLSWSKRQFSNLNNGNWYPYTYDRRHNLSIVANYQLGKHWRFSSNWIFYTGQAYTIPTHFFISSPAIYSTGLSNKDGLLFLSGLNNFRYSDYYRLDLSMAFLWGKKQRKNNLSIGVYNAYDRRNTAYIELHSIGYTDSDGNDRVNNFLQENSLYGFLPFVNLKIVL